MKLIEARGLVPRIEKRVTQRLVSESFLPLALTHSAKIVMEEHDVEVWDRKELLVETETIDERRELNEWFWEISASVSNFTPKSLFYKREFEVAGRRFLGVFPIEVPYDDFVYRLSFDQEDPTWQKSRT
ncbi:hypothetical protein [Yersinia enterocolitica]|uniref:hypothetical protein n=1 Tax=Yersinia enterocolitica TaxID=630 RepID=UPI003390487E